MNIKELKALIADLPDDMEVYWAESPRDPGPVGPAEASVTWCMPDDPEDADWEGDIVEFHTDTDPNKSAEDLARETNTPADEVKHARRCFVMGSE